MSDSFFEELEGLIGKHKQAEADKQRDEATDKRFERIETGFDNLGKLIEERLPANSPATDNSESGAEDKGEEKPNASGNPPPAIEEQDIEVERVTHFNVPRIYQGDDEPSIVKYIDAETGEEKTRKGRRKNRPVGYDVETVYEDTTPEPVNIPTEPDEATA